MAEFATSSPERRTLRSEVSLKVHFILAPRIDMKPDTQRLSGAAAVSIGNEVAHFEAERREPSGESMAQTHRRARALPLQTQRFAGTKCFTALPNGRMSDAKIFRANGQL